jgi:hypothetical protein
MKDKASTSRKEVVAKAISNSLETIYPLWPPLGWLPDCGTIATITPQAKTRRI